MTVAIGERYARKLSDRLEKRGLTVLWLPENGDIDPRLSGHADLSLFAAGKIAVAAKGIYPHIVNYLTNRGYSVIQAREQGPVYPSDAGLCLCPVGNYLIYNPKAADPAAVAAAGERIPVPVAQGYTRCAALAVDDRSIITSDAGVSRAAKSAGLDVLHIRPGYIGLDGYDAGFIGGSAFAISDEVIAFTGVLDLHPDKERILGFLAAHGKRADFLTEDPIFDIGGAIAV